MMKLLLISPLKEHECDEPQSVSAALDNADDVFTV
jgi:hypothetical protein